MSYSRESKALNKDLKWQREHAKEYQTADLTSSYIQQNNNLKHPYKITLYFTYTDKKGKSKTTQIKEGQTLGQVEQKIIKEHGCIILNKLLSKQKR